jgi:hypothetical protein
MTKSLKRRVKARQLRDYAKLDLDAILKRSGNWGGLNRYPTLEFAGGDTSGEGFIIK